MRSFEYRGIKECYAIDISPNLCYADQKAEANNVGLLKADTSFPSVPVNKPFCLHVALCNSKAILIVNSPDTLLDDTVAHIFSLS